MVVYEKKQVFYMKKNGTHIQKILWTMIVLGFAAIEFPGIFFINRIEPYLFGMPFLYGFVLLVWVYMCLVMGVAYYYNWGKKPKKRGDH